MKSDQVDSAISVLGLVFNRCTLGHDFYDINDLFNGDEECVVNAGATAANHLKALMAIENSGGEIDKLVSYWLFHINKDDKMVLKLIFDMYKRYELN